MMANSIDRLAGQPKQQYSERLEGQESYNLKLGALPKATRESANDLQKLLGAKTSVTQQEEQISAEVGRRMATDHIMSLQQQVTNLRDNMKDTDDRDVAIKQIETAVASTAGVAQGLSGAAAAAYDQMYIPSARQISTQAISQFKREQITIDKRRVAANFKDFMNVAADMDGKVAGNMLPFWNQRMKMNGLDIDVYKAAYQVINDQIQQELAKHPDSDPGQLMEFFKNKNFFNLITTDATGKIKFHMSNAHGNAMIGRTLGEIFRRGIAYKKQQAKIAAAKARAKARAKRRRRRSGRRRRRGGGRATHKVGKMAYSLYALEKATSAVDTSKEENKAIILKEISKISPKLAEEVKAAEADTERAVEGNAPLMTGEEREEMVKKAIEEEVLTKEEAEAIPTGDVEGPLREENQVKLGSIYKEESVKTLKEVGVEVSPNNVYTTEKLGLGPALRFFNDTNTASDFELMNEQLPENERVKYPTIQQEEVRRRWGREYRAGEGAFKNLPSLESVSSLKMKKTSKNRVTRIVAKLHKDAYKAQLKAMKQNNKDFDKNFNEFKKSQMDMQKKLDEIAMQTGKKEYITKAAKHLERANKIAKKFGEAPIFGEEYDLELKSKVLKHQEDVENNTLTGSVKAAKEIAEKTGKPLSEILEKMSDGLNFQSSREKLSALIAQHKVIEAASATMSKLEYVNSLVNEQLNPHSTELIKQTVETMTDAEKVAFTQSGTYQKYNRYLNSEQYQFDKYKEMPINMNIPSGMLSRKKRTELLEYRAGIVEKKILAAQAGDNEAAKEVINYFGSDVDSIQADQKAPIAKSILKRNLYDINSFRESIKKLPELYLNKNFLTAAYTDMQQKDVVATKVMLALISNNPDGKFPPELTNIVQTYASKLSRGEPLKGLEGEEIKVMDDPHFKNFYENVIEDGNLLPEEKQDAFLAAKLLASAGYGEYIETLVGSYAGRYVNDVGRLKGRFSAIGLNEQLGEVLDSQDEFTAIALRSIATENDNIDFNEALKTYKPLLDDGEFTFTYDKLTKEYSIIFPDPSGKYSVKSPRFLVDLSKWEAEGGHHDANSGWWDIGGKFADTLMDTFVSRPVTVKKKD